MFNTLKPPLGVRLNLSHPLANGLLGCWLMNEGSGLTFYDLSENGNAAKATGTLSDFTWMAAPGGIVMDFLGDNVSYFELTREITFTATTPWSLTFRVIAHDQAEAILIGDPSNENDYIFLYGDNYVAFKNSAGVETRIDTGLPASTDFSYWSTYTLTSDGIGAGASTLKLYRDGVFVGENTDETLTFNIAAIGCGYPNAAYAFDGQWLFAYIHNFELTLPQAHSLHINPYAMFEPDPIFLFAQSVTGVIAGDTCWGHVTAVTETNVQTFTGNWTGTGTIGNAGDAERLELNSTEYMISEVVNTGTDTVTLLQNEYDPTGDDVDMDYRHGADAAACEVAGWNNYTVPFVSLGYVQVKMTSTL